MRFQVYLFACLALAGCTTSTTKWQGDEVEVLGDGRYQFTLSENAFTAGSYVSRQVETNIRILKEKYGHESCSFQRQPRDYYYTDGKVDYIAVCK